MVKLEMIVAHDLNRAIGVNGGLPWHIPQDLQWFKDKTMGKAMIMGRKTYESIGRPLPGRTTVMITSQDDYPAKEGMVVVRSLAEAIIRVLDLGMQPIVVGGGQVYADALPYTARIYITKVNTDLLKTADTYFPELSEADWSEIDLWDIVEGDKTICTVHEYTRKQMCGILKANHSCVKVTDVQLDISS